MRFASPQRGPIGLVILLMLAVATINAVEPLILKIIFDGLGASDGHRALLAGVAGLAAIMLARELMDGAANWLRWRARAIRAA
jgi:ATP-binding cassette subfamily B protein